MGVEGRAPSAQHALLSQQSQNNNCHCKGKQELYQCAHQLCPSEEPQLQFPMGRMIGFGNTIQQEAPSF